MNTDLRETVKMIDDMIRKHAWFDFHVFRYTGRNLIVAGSTDLCYYHTLEIIFENVFCFHGFFSEWHSDTSQPVFVLPSHVETFNLRFEIEQGYTLFMFKTEDYSNNVYIASEKITFNTDTVFYYLRENLKENERIADFVTR